MREIDDCFLSRILAPRFFQQLSQSPHQLLPIPTHIFRLSDSSSNRYLLCPDHCLLRLRAVCAFWGYLRSLERQIVLEGRRPWEEIERKNGALEREKKRLEEESNKKKDTETDVQDPVSNQPQSEVKKDQVEILEKAAEADEEALASEDEEDEFTEALSTGHEGSTENSPENLRSTSPLPQVQVQGTEKKEDVESKEEEEASKEDDPDKLSVDVKSANATSSEGETELKTPTGSSSAPPLPRRSEARRAVPAPPVPSKENSAPPALPPRARTPSSNTIVQSQTPAPVHSLKKSLPFNVEIKPQDGIAIVEPLSWEEKTWLEVARLREEMWKARMGISEIEDEEEQEREEVLEKSEGQNGNSDEKEQLQTEEKKEDEVVST